MANLINIAEPIRWTRNNAELFLYRGSVEFLGTRRWKSIQNSVVHVLEKPFQTLVFFPFLRRTERRIDWLSTWLRKSAWINRRYGLRNLEGNLKRFIHFFNRLLRVTSTASIPRNTAGKMLLTPQGRLSCSVRSFRFRNWMNLRSEKFILDVADVDERMPSCFSSLRTSDKRW